MNEIQDMMTTGRAHGPGGMPPWPHDLANRAAEIRKIAASNKENAVLLADALAAECVPVIRVLVRRHCHKLNRPDLMEDAGQNAFWDVLCELRSGSVRKDIRPYLQKIVRNAVSKCLTAEGGLAPTAAQRRRASIARASAAFLNDHGRYPSDTELLAAQHQKMSSRADPKDQAALASLEEVRASMAGEEPFVADDDVSGTGWRSTDSRLPCRGDHVEADLALDPLDAQRLISLTAAACRDLRPGLNGHEFAVAVMTKAMCGTLDVTRLARDFELTRSVARTAVKKVWKAAERVARDDLGVTSVRVGP